MDGGVTDGGRDAPGTWATRYCADDGASAFPAEHPFAPQPATASPLVDVSADLQAVLEGGTLPTACDEWQADPENHDKMLKCGKWMFFYETFGTAGMPRSLVKFLVDRFPDQVGRGFERMGMVADPYSQDGMPLGLADTAVPTTGSISYTCASCHFARLPDGRYAVGAPNHAYDYGGQVLTIFLFPQMARPFSNAADHDPSAISRVTPLLDTYRASPALQLEFLGIGLSLASQLGSAPTVGPELEAAYASWRTGTMDFMMAPTPIDDGVHTVHRIQPLWGIPSLETANAAGMTNAMLGWSGGTADIHEFLLAFVDLGFGQQDAWPRSRLEPLAQYISSLRAPSNPTPPDPALARQGCELFESKGCLECHGGVGGSGRRTYSPEEVGTDPAIARWMDADLDGQPCCNIDDPDFVLTHGVKSPRLLGMWSMSRFLHNGSLDSLDELFCLSQRPPALPAPLGNQGHTFTCEGLSPGEKAALKGYLLSH